MSSLDDKLKSLHINASSMFTPDGKVLPTWYELADHEIDQIKQAFADEGIDFERGFTDQILERVVRIEQLILAMSSEAHKR